MGMHKDGLAQPGDPIQPTMSAVNGMGRNRAQYASRKGSSSMCNIANDAFVSWGGAKLENHENTRYRRLSTTTRRHRGNGANGPMRRLMLMPLHAVGLI